MDVLANRLNRIEESLTFQMSQKSADLKAKGVDVINLTIGEPDFYTPDYVKEAAKKAIDENDTFYSAVEGKKELIAAIINKFKRENNVDYKPSQIVVSNGAKHSLANVIMSIVDHGDEILIPTPYWVTYKELDNLANGKSIFIETTLENNFKVTAQQIREAITPKTRVLLYSSPSNPTGMSYTKAELKEIADVIAEHPNIYVISDEIYEHLHFGQKHESISQFEFIKNQLIIINGVSKAYAMTGWRIGYMAAPEWIAKACKKLQGQFSSGACSISQKAAEAALNLTTTLFDERRIILKERCDLVCNILKQMPDVKFTIPNGTFYVFPDISAYFGKSDGKRIIKDSNDMSMYFLEEAHVAVVAGSAFGEDKCVRLSFTVDIKILEKALTRIKISLEMLKIVQ